MQVICINDENKPVRISFNEWIKKGEVYTVIKAVRMGLQAGKFGFLLKEIQLSEMSFPYEFYDSARFAIYENNVIKAEAIKEEEVIFDI